MKVDLLNSPTDGHIELQSQLNYTDSSYMEQYNVPQSRETYLLTDKFNSDRHSRPSRYETTSVHNTVNHDMQFEILKEKCNACGGVSCGEKQPIMSGNYKADIGYNLYTEIANDKRIS
jgi:hypothetical protein